MTTLHPFFTPSVPAGPYRDPATEQLENGQTVAQAVPASPARGVRGTIVPTATPGGIPYGSNPHDTSRMVVQLSEDPKHPKPLTLSNVTPEVMRAASEQAALRSPPPRNVADQREIAALAMDIAAESVGNFGAVKSGAVRSTPSRSPMAAFAGSPIAGSIPALPVMPAATPPTVQVTYEAAGFGTLPASYHAVIQQPGFMVLVHNLQWPTPPYFPPATGVSVGQLAMYVEGDDSVHVVEATGIIYDYGPTSFCV